MRLRGESMVRVWQIGLDGTEFYAARSYEEMFAYYCEIVGQAKAAEDFNDESTYELGSEEMDAMFRFDDDGD